MILNFMTSLFDVAKYGFFSIFLYIDSVVYKVVSMLFSVFYSLAGLEILNNNFYENIANRVYLLVGIIALFSMTVSLLKALVEPDNLAKSTITSFKNLVSSIILLILIPTIFKYAFSFQAAIINDGIINNIFNFSVSGETPKMVNFCNNPESVTVNNSEFEALTVKKKQIKMKVSECQSNFITMTILEAFFSPSNENIINNYNTKWSDAKKYIIYSGDFDYIATFAEQVNKGSGNYYISYYILISTIAGIFLGYIVLTFCLDLGIRAFKLAFYQLIAPIPILMKIIPGKEGQFEKWSKQVISAYLEVFTRLIIMSFVVFMCGNLFKLFDGLDWGGVEILGKAILALGMFAFAKQAPKLLTDALGLDGSGLKFGIKGKLAAGGALAAGAAIGAGATTFARNTTNAFKEGFNNVNSANGFSGKSKAVAKSLLGGTASVAAGTVSGFARGAKAGWGSKNYSDVSSSAGKAARDAVEAREKRAIYKATHGGTIRGAMSGHIADAGYNARNWATGGTAGILGKVAFEEEFKDSYNEFQALYENPNYKAMDSQLQQYKALQASGVQNYQGTNVSDAIKTLEGNMLKSRMDAIRNNSQAAAYSMYNIAQIAKKNPRLASQIGIDVSKASDLQLKGNKIYDKTTGVEISSEKLYDIIEGSSFNDIHYNGSQYVNSHGVAIDFEALAAGHIKDGMIDQKKVASNALRNDKMSVEYKEAMKNKEKK